MTKIVALKYVIDRVVMVGCSERIRDHGTICWLCRAYPPLENVHVVRFSLEEVVEWLRKDLGADEVLYATVIEE